jgi:hypothetical protein
MPRRRRRRLVNQQQHCPLHLQLSALRSLQQLRNDLQAPGAAA